MRKTTYYRLLEDAMGEFDGTPEEFGELLETAVTPLWPGEVGNSKRIATRRIGQLTNGVNILKEERRQRGI